MPDELAEDDSPVLVGRVRGCWAWCARMGLVVALLLMVSLVWLNGPGVRWLGPSVVSYFLEREGMSGVMRLDGTLLGGLEVYDLKVEGDGAVALLVVDELKLDYRFSELLRGRLRSVEGAGVELHARLMGKVEEDDEKVDFVAFAEMLGRVRGLVVPLGIDLQDIDVRIEREEELLLSFTEAAVVHVGGEDVIYLDMGLVEDAAGRSLRMEDAGIVWEEGRLGVKKLGFLPELGLVKTEIFFPKDGAFAAHGMVRLEGAVMRFDLMPGLGALRVDLSEGVVDLEALMGGLALDVPLRGRLNSLSLNVENFYPDWRLASGDVEFSVVEPDYDGWGGDELSARVMISEGVAEARVIGSVLGSPVEVTAKSDLGNVSEGAVVEGVLELGKVEGVLARVGERLELERGFEAFPASRLGGQWRLEFGEKFEGVSADLVLGAEAGDTSPLRVKAGLRGGQLELAALEADGLSVRGKYDFSEKVYEGQAVLEGFRLGRLERWLLGVGVSLPGAGEFTALWKGGGAIGKGEHAGVLELESGVWDFKEEDRASIFGQGEVSYRWPGKVDFSQLELGAGEQRILVDAELADELFRIGQFTWYLGDEKIGEGKGELPFPRDFSDLKGFLKTSDRPVDFTFRTEDLPISILEPWLGGGSELGPDARGRVDLQIRQTVANPRLDGDIFIKNMKPARAGDFPAIDLQAKLQTKGGRLELQGNATAPDIRPAIFELKIPLHLKRWIDEPSLVKEARVEGFVELLGLQISRFRALVPSVRDLHGVADGKVKIAGTIGAPEVIGGLSLVGGRVVFENHKLPDLDGVEFELKGGLDELKVRAKVANLEGGSMDVEGSFSAAGSEDSSAVISVRGKGVPFLRNDMLIVRANVDLEIQGSLEQAKITGKVGVIDSLFYKDIELIPIGKPFLGASAAKLPAIETKRDAVDVIPEVFQKWTMNVEIKTIDPILVRGNVGTGSIDIGLRVEGELGDPKANGEVRLRKAAVYLPFSKMEVKAGVLRFSPKNGLKPTIDLRGVSELRPYRVEAYVYGQAADPQLALTSQPPLPENEIMTLLATGTTSAGLENSQVVVSRAMQLLLEEIRRGRFVFGRQLRPVLRLLDGVEFSLLDGNPYDSETYHSASTKLSNRWYFVASMGAAGDERVMAIYRLNFR